MPVPVSICLIAKNEEHALPTCLASAAPLGAELVVVDTGSTDRTKEVAAAHGARVFDFPWCDHFAAARNECLRHATGAWALWLDADEVIDDANRQRLRDLFAGLKDDNTAYVMNCLCREEHGGPATLVNHVRLFRNRPEHRWQYRVHEQILPALHRTSAVIRFADVTIEHTGYQDPLLRRRKQERNLRLLHLEQAEHPDDPYTLFNLGWTNLELGKAGDALPFLRRSLQRASPGASIIRKLYPLLAAAYRQVGQRYEAATTCRAGLARFPDDDELLFLHGQLLAERGDSAGAAACFRVLVEGRPELGQPAAHFASLDPGLRGYQARYQLGRLARQQGQDAEAEAHWRAAVAERPDYAPAWLELGELAVAQARWDDAEQAAARLDATPLASKAAGLRARALLARKDYGAARTLLEAAIARDPQALTPRIVLSHALLQEGQDPAAAERALRAVLVLDPSQAESWRNLAVLLRHHGRLAEAAATCQAASAHCPADPELLLLDGILRAELGDAAGTEACLLRVLEVLPDRAVGSRAGGLRAEARQRLARLYSVQGRLAEAEAQWRAVLAADAEQTAAWQGLGDVCVRLGRWPEVEQIAARLENGLHEPVEAALLRVRGCLGRREFAAARGLLEPILAGAPQALGPRVLLTHILLQEGHDGPAAEQALREVLALAPHHAEARHNLAILLRQQGRTPGD